MVVEVVVLPCSRTQGSAASDRRARPAKLLLAPGALPRLWKTTSDAASHGLKCRAPSAQQVDVKPTSLIRDNTPNSQHIARLAVLCQGGLVGDTEAS